MGINFSKAIWFLLGVLFFIPNILVAMFFGIYRGLVFWYSIFVNNEIGWRTDKKLLAIDRGLFISKNSPIYKRMKNK